MNAQTNPRAVMGANDPPLADRLAMDEADTLLAVQAIADRANVLPRKLTAETADADIAAIGEVVRDAGALAKKIERRRVEVKQPWLDGQRTVDGFFHPLDGRLSTIVTAFTRVVTDFREEQRRAAAKIAAEEARKREAEEARRRAEAQEAERRGRERTAALAHQQAEAAAQQADEARERETRATAPLPARQVNAQVGEGVTLKSKGEWAHRTPDIRKIDLESLRPYLKADHVDQAIRLAIRQGVREIGGVEIFQQEKIHFG